MELMISKEQFIKALNDVKAIWDYQEDLNEVYRRHGADGYLYQPDCTDTVIRLLHEIMGPVDSQDLISYFVFDLEFGSAWTPGTVSDDYGNDLKLQTPSDLYDALNQIWEEQKKFSKEVKGDSK